MGKLFDLEADGYFYTRLQNPTNDMVAAMLTSSIYGGTYNLFETTMKKMGIECTFVD